MITPETAKMMLEALRKIAFLRPAGPSRGGLVEQMERIALAAITRAEEELND